jgi:exonuclease SbcD
MKILHTSDWHLGKRLGEFQRLPEQKDVLDEICTIADAENVNAVIISGDLFDTFNPQVEAVELFYKTLKRLAADGKRAVIAIAGNHDSPERIEAPDPLARECGIIMTGYPHTQVPLFGLNTGLQVIASKPGITEILLPGFAYPLRILHTSYANELRLKTYLGESNTEQSLRDTLKNFWEHTMSGFDSKSGVNIMSTHLYMVQREGVRPEEPTDEEKPILLPGGVSEIYTESVPDSIHYVALGHLHRHQIITSQPCPVVYSGSPVAYSFSEAFQDKYVEIIEAEPGTRTIHRPVLLQSGKKLIRKRFENLEDALIWLPQHTDCLLELTLCVKNYLSPEILKELNALHPGIISIIPEITGEQNLTGNNTAMPDLSKNTEELFIEFFRSRKQGDPDQEMLDLLKEIIAGEEEQ